MNDLQIARMLTELGTEIAVASEHSAQAARLNAQAIKILAAVNVRIQGLVNRLLVEEADVVEAVAAPAKAVEPEAAPAAAAAPAEDPAPLIRPEIYEEVLNCFAVTGHSTSVLAQGFGARVGIISRCLDVARQTNDARAAQGDLKRAESVEADAGPSAGIEAGSNALRTIEPEPHEVGLVLATVAYTDGTASRADTGDHVRMKGPGLRVVALLKDQRLYPLDEVMKASRIESPAVFRSNMIDIQRSLAVIGLHIVESSKGLQLRRLDPKQARTRSAA